MFTWNENFSSISSNRDEVSAYNRNSISTFLSLTMQDKMSSRFNELKFHPGLKILTQAAPKTEFVAKIGNYFRKKAPYWMFD